MFGSQRKREEEMLMADAILVYRGANDNGRGNNGAQTEGVECNIVDQLIKTKQK